MELQHDWKIMEKNFLQSTKPEAGRAKKSSYEYLLLVEGEKIHAAWSKDGKDVSYLQGERISMIREKLGEKNILAMTREEMDGWVNDSTQAGNFLDEEPRSSSQYSSASCAPHFLLSWLNDPGKVFGLPSSYGLYLRIKESNGDLEETLVVRRRGKLDQMTRPDFSPLGPERSQNLPEVLRFLAERFGVAIQMIEITRKDWIALSSSAKPWREFLTGIRSGKIRLSPAKSRMILTALMRWI